MPPSTPATIPEAYRTPQAYLGSSKFHQLHIFDVSSEPGLSSLFQTEPPLHVSYALCGSTDPDAPVLLWINGLGHHRLACVLFDGICQEKGIRLLSIERPSCGLSSPLPDRLEYSSRVDVVIHSILSVLRQHDIHEFSLLSHSNGLIYALALLLKLHAFELATESETTTTTTTTTRTNGEPRRARCPVCHDWFLTSPWVSPGISGNLGLGLVAKWVPNGLTSRLGGLVERVEKVVGPVGSSYGIAKGWIGWSASLIGSSSSSLSSSTTATRLPRVSTSNGATLSRNVSSSQEPEVGTRTQPSHESQGNADPTTSRKARDQIESFETLQRLKPVEERTFGGRYFPAGILDEGMKYAVREGLEGMGFEAVMCLRGTGVRWGWLGNDETSRGRDQDEDGIPDEELYERGFTRLKEKMARCDRGMNVRVWCAGQDGLIPKKGREWLRSLMVDKLELVEREHWAEIGTAGHDEILGLEVVAEEIMSTVRTRTPSM